MHYAEHSLFLIFSNCILHFLMWDISFRGKNSRLNRNQNNQCVTCCSVVKFAVSLLLCFRFVGLLTKSWIAFTRVEICFSYLIIPCLIPACHHSMIIHLFAVIIQCIQVLGLMLQLLISVVHRVFHVIRLTWCLEMMAVRLCCVYQTTWQLTPLHSQTPRVSPIRLLWAASSLRYIMQSVPCTIHP